MKYCRPFNFHSHAQGVTLIELLLVVAITLVVGVAVVPLGAGFLVRNQLENKTNEIVSSLRTAQLNSISGKEQSSWGATITSNKIIMFRGSTYSSPGTVFDQSFDVPQSISITAVEIVFDRLTGNPNAPATITLTSNTGDNSTVVVNEVGTVDVY